MTDTKIMSVSEAVNSRTSMRAFRDTPVPGELVRQLLSAAARSPSGGNLQPWQVYVLGGEALKQFKAQVLERMKAGPRNEGTEFDIYPREITDPYKTRSFRCAEAMYGSMGIPREDKMARLGFIAGNFQFWGAPVGLFFCLDRQMGPPQFSDLGMYLQTLMLLAREAGLDTCAQEAWAMRHKTVGELLQLPDNLMLFCGLAMGYADHQHPVSKVRTERAALEEFATFRGI